MKKIKYNLQAIFAVAILGLVVVFALRSMFPSGEFEYRFERTEEAIVTSNVGPGGISRSRTPSIMVKTKSGLIVRVMHPTQNSYVKGDVVKVDVLTARGRRPVYRLAQNPQSTLIRAHD